MPKELAVAFSDSHLRARTWAGRTILGDSYFSFDQICSYAVARELPLIGAGDLIDKRVNEPSPIVYLTRKLRQLSKANCPFYFTQGQHELDDEPWLGVGSNKVVHLHKKTIELGGLKIYGLDFQSVENLKTELDLIPPGTDVGVMHQVWGDFMGQICLPQGDFADIPYIRTLITGDFHETVDSTYRGKDGQKIKVFSPGSTCMQNISEPDRKCFGVLMSDGSISKHELLTRSFIDWPIIHSEDDMEIFLASFEAEYAKQQDMTVNLPDELRTPLLRVTYSHRVSDATRRVGKLVGERAHVFFKELPPEKAESKILAKVQETVPNFRKGDALTLAVMLPQVINKTQEPETFALSQRLLDAEDPKAELSRWKREQLNDGADTEGG